MPSLELYKKRYEFNGIDPRSALYVVGANDEFEIEAQPKFMKEHGLAPQHKFLDLACGCLRGTIKLIDYLEPGNFHGADISPGLLKTIPDRCAQQGIVNKPVLWLINDYNFKKYMQIKFDFILSVSFLTHLLPAVIPDLFLGVSKILAPKGTWYFTLYPTDSADHHGDIEISYFRKSWLIEEGAKAGLKIEDIEGDFPNASPISNYIERVNVEGMAQWVMKASLKKEAVL